MNSIVTGLVAGSIAVATVWLSRVVLPPREPALPDAIRLDTLRAYADRPSRNADDLLADADLLDRVVATFAVAGASVDDALAALGAAAGVNVVVVWERVDPEALRRGRPVTLSLRSKSVGQILEMIFEPPFPEDVTQVGWFARDGIVYVTDHDYAAARYFLRVHDVRDLMAESGKLSATFKPSTRATDDQLEVEAGSEQEAVDRLIGVLDRERMAVHGGSAINSVNYFAGRLLVEADRTGHQHVEECLRLLRHPN